MYTKPSESTTSSRSVQGQRRVLPPKAEDPKYPAYRHCVQTTSTIPLLYGCLLEAAPQQRTPFIAVNSLKLYPQHP